MNDLRKRLLYFALGAMVIYLGGDYLLHNYVDAPLEQRENRKSQLEKKIKKKKKKIVYQIWCPNPLLHRAWAAQ